MEFPSQPHPFVVAAHALDDAWVSRFRIGSQPVVRGVSFSPGDDEVGVTIQLSERIVDRRAQSDIVAVEHEGTRLPCRDAPGEGLSTEHGSPEINVVCPLFSMDSSVSIRLAGDLRSRVGTLVEVPFGPSPDTLVVNPVRDGAIAMPDATFRRHERPGRPERSIAE